MWVRGSHPAPETVRYMQSLPKGVQRHLSAPGKVFRMPACLETVHFELEEVMCPGLLWALVSLESKTCWGGQSAEELSFISLGGQTRDSMCKVDSP